MDGNVKIEQVEIMLENIKGYEVTLVSHSPRRRELLSHLGLQFIVVHSTVDESYPEDMDCYQIAMYLSRRKAFHPESVMKTNSLIIAADTIVWSDGKVLGKPLSNKEALDMLNELSGHSHAVITGVTLRTSKMEKTFYAETEVEFGELSDEEKDYYVRTFHPLDKAGAYGIQEWIGMIGVKRINGSFYNVMGLPVYKLYNELKNIPPCY